MRHAGLTLIFSMMGVLNFAHASFYMLGAYFGFEISRRIEERTEGALRFELASLYPMLYDLERRGLVKGQWQPSSTGRDRRYYSLTSKGKAQLAPLRQEWRSFFQALDCLAGVSNA